jgi:peptidoglycan/LPS O-acetylase OafA/YrhL
MKGPPIDARGFDAFRASSYFSALDGLRAISILMVLLHHVPKLPSGPLHTLQENGRYGVAFFFVISGFLICTLFLREEDKTGRIALGKFYGRRALRLLPLYYAALALQTLMVFGLKQYTPENQELFREKLPAYFFYFSNWLPTATEGPFFCAWSLAVEEQFYLLFGLLMFMTGRRVVIKAVAAALMLKVAVYALCGEVDAGSTLWRVVFSYQEPILLGVLIAFALNRRRGHEFLSRWLGSSRALAVIGAGLLAWLWLHPMRTQSSWDAQWLYLLMTAMVAGLVVRPATPVLGGRFMAHVGKISYGIYLLHMFVISAVKKIPGGASTLPCFLISSAVVIVVATVVYRYFERPIIAFYKQRLSPLRAADPASSQEILAGLPESRPVVQGQTAG